MNRIYGEEGHLRRTVVAHDVVSIGCEAGQEVTLTVWTSGFTASNQVGVSPHHLKVWGFHLQKKNYLET